MPAGWRSRPWPGPASSRRRTDRSSGATRELAALDRLFTSAIDAAAPRFALLVGEAGIGKSRLVREFAALFEERPRLVIWRQGRCLPYGEGAGLAALAEVVKAHAGILETDEAATVERKLEAVLPRGDDGNWIGRRLRSLVGLESAEGSREESFAAWTAFIEHLAVEHPAVLVLEDLHWADEAMLAFVEGLAGAADGVPLLVLATARPELLDRAARLAGEGSGFARIDLDPLTTEAARDLAGALWGEGAASAAETRDAILERSGGNPFFLSESIKLALEEPGRSLPASVQAVIAARLDALPGPNKALLAEAAVVGHTFWPGALLALDSRSPEDVEEGLAFLVARQLIVEERASSVAGERQYAFWHALTREVAYRPTAARVRLRAHVAAAGWIERAAGGRPEQVAEVLAHHHVTALDLARSLRDQQQVDSLVAPAGAVSGAGRRARLRLRSGDRGAVLQAGARLAASRPPPRARLIRSWQVPLSHRSHPGGPRAPCGRRRLLSARGRPQRSGALWGRAVHVAGEPRRSGLRRQIPDRDATPRPRSPDPRSGHGAQGGLVPPRRRAHGPSWRRGRRRSLPGRREALGHPSPPDAYVWRAEGRAALGAGDWMQRLRPGS